MDSEAVFGTEFDVKQHLKQIGIQIPRGHMATSVDDAVSIASELGYPVALKGQVAEVPHKTEHHLVHLGLENEVKVRVAFAEVELAMKSVAKDGQIRGVLVEEMAPEGVDVIVGCVHDEVFGPTVMVGLGGVHVEIFEDVSFRVAPVSVNVAIDMINEIRGVRLLNGFRGAAICDLRSLAEIISRISNFAVMNQKLVKEIEINPVRAHKAGAMALDGLVLQHLRSNS